MVIDHERAHGEDSPVMNETLSVIDEHITDLNTPRSSLLASTRKNPNDSGSEYSSHLDHRLSYITGNETDEEESDPITEDEVARWNPAQVAEYLHEIGVEQKHCDIFQEQEISGEVLLDIDKSSLFMKELDLGSVGRRLATWHKVKAFQDDLKSRNHSRHQAPDNDGSVIGSIGGTASISYSSANGSVFPRASQSINRSPTFRHSRQNSPRIMTEPYPSNNEGDGFGVPRLYSTETSNRPSAASVRDYNHSRRHSSVDVGKSEASSSLHAANESTPLSSPLGTPHKKQPSFDRNWTMSAFPQPTSAGVTRASTMMLGLGGLGMAGHGLPAGLDRKAFTPGANESENPMDNVRELERGYLSTGEMEGSRKNRNVLRKNGPGSASHSRQTSQKDGDKNNLSVGKRHSRFGSAGSIMEALASVTASGSKQSNEAKARARTQSMRETSTSTSSPSTTTTTPSASTPLVTKLEYTESPTSLTGARSNPASPLQKQDSFGATNQVINKFRTSIRSSSDAVTGIEKSQISSPTSIPPPIKEDITQSPARTGSSTPSAASKSLELESVTDTSGNNITLVSTNRTATMPARKRAKSKRETSAYKSLLVISPHEAMKGCNHSGWMYKKSAKMTSTFKVRFFILRDKRLSYYYTMDDKIEKGLIDISSHRVMMVENDIMTNLYGTLARTKSNPTSPAVPSPASDTTGGPFFFKLVPPRTGLSKAVQFTRPAVHYFAADNYEDGRKWYLSLKKASIDLDRSEPIRSTYSQKTISLEKAQSMKHRPPALMNLDETVEPSSDEPQSKEELQDGEDGLNISGLNLSYENIDVEANNPTSGNGTAQTYDPDGNSQSSHELKRPQSDQPLSKVVMDGSQPSSTLRMVRSLSGGLSKHNFGANSESNGEPTVI